MPGNTQFDRKWEQVRSTNLNIGQALKLFAGSFRMEMGNIDWDQLSSVDDVASFVADNARKRYKTQNYQVPDQPLAQPFCSFECAQYV